MEILDDSRKETGWIIAVIEGRVCEAKVYDQPSPWGIDRGRVHRLMVLRKQKTPIPRTFYESFDFYYSRELIRNELPPEVLEKILLELEALPLAGG